MIVDRLAGGRLEDNLAWLDLSKCVPEPLFSSMIVDRLAGGRLEDNLAWLDLYKCLPKPLLLLLNDC